MLLPSQSIAITRLLDPQTTVAVILGSSVWENAGIVSAPSFLRSKQRLIKYLGSDGLGLNSKLIVDLFGSDLGASDQISLLADEIRLRVNAQSEAGIFVEDILFYYIGHGVPYGNHLSLLVKSSKIQIEAETGIKTHDLASVLRSAAPKQRRILILDCCFSERAVQAFIGMAGPQEQAAAITAKDFDKGHPTKGTIAFCSSSSSEISIGAPDAPTTLFTGALLDVLEGGIDNHLKYLSFTAVKDATDERMALLFDGASLSALHQPDQKGGNLLLRPAFPNAKWSTLGQMEFIFDNFSSPGEVSQASVGITSEAADAPIRFVEPVLGHSSEIAQVGPAPPYARHTRIPPEASDGAIISITKRDIAVATMKMGAINATSQELERAGVKWIKKQIAYHDAGMVGGIKIDYPCKLSEPKKPKASKPAAKDNPASKEISKGNQDIFSPKTSQENLIFVFLKGVVTFFLGVIFIIFRVVVGPAVLSWFISLFGVRFETVFGVLVIIAIISRILQFVVDS